MISGSSGINRRLKTIDRHNIGSKTLTNLINMKLSRINRSSEKKLNILSYISNLISTGNYLPV
ncbi:hypothetical protein BLOT_010000 [Blomia tropicalis]|nr:hypothetical protein BLOT_010000 [Blomia tropicalis]